MKIRTSLYLLCVFCLACRKIPPSASNLPSADFSQVFDEFWNDMNINYMYWDIDTTDWDAVYTRYNPLFGQLHLGDSADLEKSVGYFRSITDGLIDHHYSMSFLNAALSDSLIDPAIDQLRKEPGFRGTYSFLFTDEHYLDTGYQYGFYNAITPPLLTLSGTIGGSILFFSCNQFDLSDAFHSSVSNSARSVLQYFLNKLQHPEGLKGILLDFRGNPGGAVSDLDFFGGQFVPQPLHFGYTRYKSGNGRLDYTPWIDADVTPQAGAVVPNLPIVILADRYTASMAEILSMALRTLPHCRIVGETTFGATGPFTDNALYDDGPFQVPGFLSVITSSAEFKYIDGKSYEGKGFPPDYPVAFDANALIAGDDPQMDKALSLMK